MGFEPTLPFRVNTLSKRAPSATRPSLRRESIRKERLVPTSLHLHKAANACSSSILWVKLRSPQLESINVKGPPKMPSQVNFRSSRSANHRTEQCSYALPSSVLCLPLNGSLHPPNAKESYRSHETTLANLFSLNGLDDNFGCEHGS